MNLDALVGYKFFKIDKDDNVKFVRLIRAKEKSVIVSINDTDELTTIKTEDLKTKYKFLKPDGVLMFYSVTLEGNKDVIIASYLLDRMEQKDVKPFCICRQGITDVYYNLLAKDESEMIAGLSMNILNIPNGFDYGLMIVSDEVLSSNTIMIYKDDTVEKILRLFKKQLKVYDDTLDEMYTKHCESNPAALFCDEDKGWCKSLEKLLVENNFQSDLDEMFGITTVQFPIEDYLVKTKVAKDEEEEYYTVTDELRYWLSYLYKLDINKIYVLEYEYDDLDFLKNCRYFIFRDSNSKLYIFVYTIGKEYKEAELEILDRQLDFSTKFRIKFWDKYRELHKE